MDSGVERTQKIVITVAVILAILIVVIIGYSLYVKAKRAEGELANIQTLQQQTSQNTQKAGISLTDEAKNSSGVTYDGLVQKRNDTTATPTDFGIVNEQAPVDIPQEENISIDEASSTPVVVKKVYTSSNNEDRPLTAEEIRAIRQLPIDNSPSGNLQNALEKESGGQYKAQY